MRTLLVAIVICAVTGCATGSSETVVPSNFNRPLDDALRRLHAAGLRATFPAARTPCGNGLPYVSVQNPRAPARVPRNSAVELRFHVSPIPSPGFPTRHPKFTTVPDLVGREFSSAAKRLRAIWPCVHVRAATATSSTRVVVIAQRPKPGTRVPAYGVRVGRGFRPTTMDIAVAAR